MVTYVFHFWVPFSPFQQWFQSFLVQLHGLTEVPKWLCRDPQTLEIKTERILRVFEVWVQSERLTHEVNICFSYLNSCKLPSGQSMAHLWLKNIRILDHVLKVLETTLQQTDVALCNSYPQIIFGQTYLCILIFDYTRASRIQRFVIGSFLIKESDFPLPCLIAQGGPDAHRYSSYQCIYIYMPFRRETLLQSVPLLRRAPDEDRKNLDVHDRRELATLMKSTFWMRKRLPGWKSLEVIV